MNKHFTCNHVIKNIRCGCSKLLFFLVFFICMNSYGFSQESSISKTQKKHIRLHVVALGMKDQSAGMTQLKNISDAGHGKFDTADNFKQLEQAFTKVAKDTSTIIVTWPGENSVAINNRNQSLLNDPWVMGLTFVLVVLIILTSGVIYTKSHVYHLFILEPERKPRNITFKKKSIWIGRHNSCDIVLIDTHVSKKHLKVSMKKRGVGFKDNLTENGSFVSGKKVEQGFLPYGNSIIIGKTQLRITRER